MPTNKNAMTRYKILDELLSDRYHNYSLDDLTEEVSNRLSEMFPGSDGVARRTIEKDIHYLEKEEPFLAEIERYTVTGYDKEKQKNFQKKCLRYADLTFSIFKKKLTSDEAYLLRETLSLLGQFQGLPNLGALEVLKNDLGIENDERKILSFTKNPLEGSTILGELFMAISQKQTIEIGYHKFSETSKILNINIYPYLLKEYNRRWFLFASAEADGKLLCFGLDRIGKVRPLPSHKYVEYNGDIFEYFEDIIGVTNISDTPIYSVYFWVSDSSMDYVLTKPLHESQRSVKGEKEQGFRSKYQKLVGGRYFRIDCKFNYELIRELSSFGNDLLVVEPKEIQDKIVDRIEKMNDCYLNLRNEL